MRQKPFHCRRLCRRVDYRDTLFVQFGHLFVSVGAKHRSCKKLVHSIAYVCKPEHTDIINIAQLHLRAKIVFHNIHLLKKGGYPPF